MAKSEMVEFEKEMRGKNLGAEKISLCCDIIREIYIGQNIRKEGTLQSDFDNFDIELIKLLLKRNYIERDRFYLQCLYCTTEKGSKIGKIEMTNMINNNKEFIENFLAEQPQKVLNFIIREHLLKVGRPPLYIYPVDANDISGFDVKDRLRKNNKIHTEWTSVLSTLRKKLKLCIKAHSYVGKDSKPREEYYVITPEILEFLEKHCPKEEVFTPGEYDKMRVYDVLSYFMRSSDYSSDTFKDALRERLIDFELEPEKVKVVIEKMAEVGITSGYRGFQSPEAPFSIKDQYKYEEWLEKNLLEPVVESLLGSSGKGGNGSPKLEVSPNSYAFGDGNDEDEPIKPSGPIIESEGTVSGNEEGILFKVGKEKETSQDIWWWLGHTDLTPNYNIGVLGKSGYGKTQLVKSLIYNIFNSSILNNNSPVGFLIFDFKGDYIEPEKEDYFVEKLETNIIKPINLPVNLLELNFTSERSVTDKLNQIESIFTNVFGEKFGTVQTERLISSLENVYKNYGLSNGSTKYERGIPTIYDLFEDIRKQHGESKPDKLISIINKLERNDFFERDPDKCMPIIEFFKGVNIIPLNDLSSAREFQEFICSIFTYLFYEHMYRLKKEENKETLFGPDSKRREIKAFILIDEAHHILKHDFTFLKNLMVEGRSFGFGTILATQHLSQFNKSSENYSENVETWFVGHQKEINRSDVEKTFGVDTSKSIELSNTLRKLLVLNFYFTKPYYKNSKSTEGT